MPLDFKAEFKQVDHSPICPCKGAFPLEIVVISSSFILHG